MAGQMQLKVMAELRRIVEDEKLDFVDNPEHGNTGVFFVQRGWETLLIGRYEFQNTYMQIGMADNERVAANLMNKATSKGYADSHNGWGSVRLAYDEHEKLAAMFAFLTGVVKPEGPHDYSKPCLHYQGGKRISCSEAEAAGVPHNA